MSIIIVPNKEGAKVTPYKNNPKFGYVHLSEESKEFSNGWLRVKKRDCLIRGESAMLIQWTNSITSLPGKIAVFECLESAIPDKYKKQLDDSLPHEEAIKSFIKKTSVDNGSIPMTVNGERILRFSDYDETGAVVDVKVEHDNGDQIKIEVDLFKATNKTN